MPKYLQKKFRYALFASEKDIDLRNSIDLVGSAPRNLLARIQQVTGTRNTQYIHNTHSCERNLVVVYGMEGL